MTAFEPSADSSAPAGVCIHEFAMRIHRPTESRAEPHDQADTM